jgi:maltose O-acetyltransferase
VNAVRLRQLEHAFRQLRDHPLHLAARVASRARARVLFAPYQLGARVSADGWVRVTGPGRIEIGEGVHFVAGMLHTELISHGGALLQLGAGTNLNYGVSLEAHQSVIIGQRCLFASFVRVADHAEGRYAPIVIGDDVWLAHGVTVCPGVTIGDGAVVSAGSVVTSDVPRHCVARGNPAQSTPQRPREVPPLR